jgi:AcrR family transcriptional regulator
MARWDPGAQDRLRQAALDLFVERGFENVTATEIAERAGLTRRTFFRYFADKREVLFAGSEQLPAAVAEAVHAVDDTVSPMETVLQALSTLGVRLAEISDRARDRRSVIAASPELQERNRTKLAALTTALADALRERGVEDSQANLLAQVGVAIFYGAFERWVDQAGGDDFPRVFSEAVAEVRSTLPVG